jgi:hypothetical protein
MATIEDRISTLETKLKQAKAQKQKIEARKRAAESKRSRAVDTKRKVLMGAFVLEQLERNGIEPGLFTCEGKRFADWLQRDADRTVFDLNREASRA